MDTKLLNRNLLAIAFFSHFAGAGVGVLRMLGGSRSIGVADMPTNDNYKVLGNDECFRDQSETDRTKFHTSDPSEHSPLGLHCRFEVRKAEVN